MFTKFHNVSFKTDTVTGLEIDQKNTLYITTTGETFAVPFQTRDEAVVGLQELTDILNGTTAKQDEPQASKVDDLKNTVAFGFDRLQSILGDIKESASNKAQEALMAQVLGTAGKTVSDLMERKDDLVQRATDMLSTLEKLLDKDEVQEQRPMATRNKPVDVEIKTGEASDAVKRAKSIIDTDGIFASIAEQFDDVRLSATVEPKKLTVEQFKQVFGTPDEPLIGDMSERQLRDVISEFVDNAMDNERVQTLFATIRQNFSDEEADNAIEGYKNLMLTIALGKLIVYHNLRLCQTSMY